MSEDVDTIRAAHRVEDVIATLTSQQPKKKGHELWVRCPFHDDGEPSLRINADKATWFCDPCNEGGDVIRFVEKFQKVDFEGALAWFGKQPEKKRSSHGRVVAEYLYPAIDDTPACKLVRRIEYDDDRDAITGKPRKEFRQLHKGPDGEWVFGAGEPALGVYRLTELKGHRIAYVVEGESCADAGAAQGLPTTTAPGGALKVSIEHVTQLQRAGIQCLVVFPDNDEVGRAHGKKWADFGVQAGLKVKLVELPDLPPKGDLADWLASGKTKDDLIALVKAAPLHDPKRESGELDGEAYQFRPIKGVGYELLIPRLGIELKINSVRRHSRGEVTGLMTTRVNFPGAKVIPLTNHIINSAEINLAADRSRRERAKHLAERAQTGDEIDWIALVDMFAIKCLDAEMAGTTEIPLQQIVVSDAIGEMRVCHLGYSLILGHPTLWFGDGGTGKSTQAVIVAVEMAKQRKNVLYLDLEGAGDQHKRTADAYAGAGVALPGSIIYQSLDRPLVQDAPKIFELIAKYHIDLVVIDSVGFACDGSPESAEAATSFYRAVRSFGGVTTLLIAHVNRSEQGDQKPFGSIFWSNGARNMWFMKRSDADMDESQFTVGFYHRKSNFGPLRPPFGVRLHFSQTAAITATPADLGEIEELALKQPVWQRIKQYLERASMPVEASMLSSELELPPNVIQKTVSRFTNTFYKETDGRVGLRLVSTGGEVF